MEKQHILKIAGELKISENQVAAVALLLEEAATAPFIARYRKEVTGSLDEVAIMAIRDRLEQLADLDKRRAAILESLEKQGKFVAQLVVKNCLETQMILTGKMDKDTLLVIETFNRAVQKLIAANAR